MLIMILLLLSWLNLAAGTTVGTVKDYCQLEKFNATCPEGQVILMKSAEYGRMRIGRCLQSDYYTGCSTNVLSHVDGRCSGRRTCEFAIPDPELVAVQPCRADLVVYFEAAYDCIPVINPLVEDKKKKTFCRGMLDISHHQEGYISSAVTADTSLGTSSCPWQIKAQTGQKINLTLYDFSNHESGRPADGAVSAGPGRRKCPTHAVLMEGDRMYNQKGAPVKELELCADREPRRRWVYTTRSNMMWVKMVNVTPETSKNINFLIHYQAHNKLAVGDTADDEQGFPLGLLIAIAIGVVVGVVLGFVFLIAIFVCRKRSQRETKHDSGNPLMGGPAVDADQQNIYRLVEVRPPPPMMCECQYTPGPDHKSIGSMDNTLLMQPSPGEYIYRTTPRIDHGDCHHQSRDGDTYPAPNATPLKTCDIISDIQVPENAPCYDANGQEWYESSKQYNRSQSEPFPRIPPFPGFDRSERGTAPRNQVPSSRDNANMADIYEPTPGSNTSTFQAT